MVDPVRMSDTHAPARILAIEPDPQSGAVLHRILDKHVRAEVAVVRSLEAAVASIALHVPDLILTSTFMPPAALARVIDELRRHTDATHTQIISTPHFLEGPDGGPLHDEGGRVLRFPRQRTAAGAFHCDPVVLRSQVEQYLEQARALRLAARDRQQQGLLPISSPSLDGRRPDLPQPAGPSTAL